MHYITVIKHLMQNWTTALVADQTMLLLEMRQQVSQFSVVVLTN
jgi:hypothetical protein